MAEGVTKVDQRAGAGVRSESGEPAVAATQVQTLDQLGELLRRLRRRHARRQHVPQLTVRELAQQSGYARGAIAEYLSGKTLPPTDRFDVLTLLLGAGPPEQRALAGTGPGGGAAPGAQERRGGPPRAATRRTRVHRSWPGAGLARPPVPARRHGWRQGGGRAAIVVIAGTAGVGKPAPGL